MKKIILLSALIFLASCQTLSTLGETFQLIEEDPRAPTELDTNYDSFLDQKWSKDVITPIIELGFFEEKIRPNKFFDVSGGKVHVIDEGNLRIFDATSGGLRDVLPLENDKIMPSYYNFMYGLMKVVCMHTPNEAKSQLLSRDQLNCSMTQIAQL